LRLFNTQKLNFHSKECIFLGYSPSHKGYKCLDITGNFFISKDVVFNEHKFPNKELFSSQSCTSDQTISPALSTFLPTPVTTINLPSSDYTLYVHPLPPLTLVLHLLIHHHLRMYLLLHLLVLLIKILVFLHIFPLQILMALMPLILMLSLILLLLLLFHHLLLTLTHLLLCLTLHILMCPLLSSFPLITLLLLLITFIITTLIPWPLGVNVVLFNPYYNLHFCYFILNQQVIGKLLWTPMASCYAG